MIYPTSLACCIFYNTPTKNKIAPTLLAPQTKPLLSPIAARPSRIRHKPQQLTTKMSGNNEPCPPILMPTCPLAVATATYCPAATPICIKWYASTLWAKSLAPHWSPAPPEQRIHLVRNTPYACHLGYTH